MNPKEKSRKIFFLGTQMARAGAQNILLTQAQWFHDKGYEVVAAFLYDAQDLRDEWSNKYKFEILDFNAWAIRKNIFLRMGKFFRGVFNLYPYLRNNNFDMIICFTPDSNLVGIPLAYIAGIPIRIATHQGIIDNRWKIYFWIHRKMVNHKMVKKLIAASNRVKSLAVTNENIKEDKIEVILNGILINNPTHTSSEARKKLSWPEDALILLNVGRLTKQKGQKIIIEAMPKIIEKFPKAQVFIAGDGDLMEELEEKISASGLQKHIELLGVRKEIDLMLQAADLFVMPSLWEGLPIALLEAMAMELPVVISEVEGIDDVITNGDNGAVVPIGDVEAFSEAVMDLLGDPERREKMGVAARKQILANFSEEVMCQQYEKVFFGEQTRVG